MSPLPSSTLRLRPLGVFAAWNGVWLLSTAHYVLAYAFTGSEIAWERVGWNLVILNLWALATPLVVRLVQRYPVAAPRALPHLGLHLGAAVAVSVGTTSAYFLIRAGIETSIGAEFALAGEFQRMQVRTLFIDLVFYTGLVAILHALDYRRQYLDREIRAAQLEGQLATAQVQALRMQLNPHFLFNTLHAISSLMDDDVRRARRMLVDLSDLLRLSLDSVGQQEVPLDQELAFLDRYLQIERVRFGDRLTVEMDVDDGVLDAYVPNLILQPLVENALKHAVAPFAGPGHLKICARRESAAGAREETLILTVEDDGPGLPPPRGVPSGDGAPGPLPRGRGGLGLRNTRERLARLYGDTHRFELQSRPGEGLTVRLTLPFRLAPILTPS